MIKVESPDLTKLQAQMKSAPKLYRQAMLRALSTTRRDSKAQATKVAVEVYTAGRNTIGKTIKLGNVDRNKLEFTIVATRKVILLTSFEHRASKRIGVIAKPIRANSAGHIDRAFKRRAKSGKTLIMQRVGNQSYPLTALAGPSVADMFTKKAVFERIQKFGVEKMSTELQRQISVVFRG